MDLIKRLKELMLKSNFFRNVLILMSGTVVAQIITVAISPIITRLFSPSAFGIYGVYMSMVSIVVATVTLRYDQALMLPKKNEEAASLFWASLLAVLIVSSLSLILCILFFKQIPIIFKVAELGGWIIFLPVSVCLMGIYQTLTSWSARRKKFKYVSISQVVRSATTASVQVSSGLAKTGPVGLVGGAILGDFFSSLALAFQVKQGDAKIIKESLHWDSIKKLGRQYSDFPMYSAPQNLLNAISQNIPVLLLAKFFGPAVVGFYALGVRVLQFPMDLILTSLRQVFFQKASEVYHLSGNMYVLFKRVIRVLLGIIIIPALIVILFGPHIFSFVLGKEWFVAGEYARWLVLWLSIQFINLPAIILVQVHRKQRFLFFYDLFLLIFRLVALIIGGFYFSALNAIIFYSSVGVVFNLFIIIYMWAFLRNNQINNLLTSKN